MFVFADALILQKFAVLFLWWNNSCTGCSWPIKMCLNSLTFAPAVRLCLWWVESVRAPQRCCISTCFSDALQQHEPAAQVINQELICHQHTELFVLLSLPAADSVCLFITSSCRAVIFFFPVLVAAGSTGCSVLFFRLRLWKYWV